MRVLNVKRPPDASYTPLSDIGQTLLERSRSSRLEETLALYSTMLFPEDVDRQNAYLVGYYFANVPGSFGLDAPEWRGAGEIILANLESDLKRCQSIWVNVGDQLITLLRLRASSKKAAREASLSKARFLLEATDAPNRQRLEQEWAGSKNVAHLLAASNLMVRLSYAQVGLREEINVFSPVLHDPFTLLGLARGIELECENYIPSGSRQPILIPETVWHVPADFEPIWLELRPLGEDELGQLESYEGRRARTS